MTMQGMRVCWPERGKAILESFEVREPGSGEVLVRSEVTLISPGTERAFFLGLPNAQGRFPSYPGYSHVGRVLRAGAGVEGIPEGARVVSGGGHASCVTVRADRCVVAPEEGDPKHAVFHSLGAIALQGVRKSRVELGEAAATLGLGLVGSLALQLTRLQGALPAVGLDLDPGRRDLAVRCGADLALDPSGEAGLEAARAACGGSGPAVVIEATGFPEAVNVAFALAGNAGRVVLLASTRGVTETNFYQHIHKKGLIVHGAHNSARPARESSAAYWTLADDTRTVLRLLAAGRLQVEPYISEVFPAAEAARAYEVLGSWRKDLLGMVLDWR